jgi:hypothetical protein
MTTQSQQRGDGGAMRTALRWFGLDRRFSGRPATRRTLLGWGATSLAGLLVALNTGEGSLLHLLAIGVCAGFAGNTAWAAWQLRRSHGAR